MQDDARGYVERGEPIGGFLKSVFENNFASIVIRADEENLRNLPAWGEFLYWQVPEMCWGSPEAVKEWQKIGGTQGLNKKGEDDR